jgi:hypothetical protein
MEGWNTTNSTSRRELFAQVRFDLHEFNRYFFILLAILYIHFIYLKLSKYFAISKFTHCKYSWMPSQVWLSLTPDLIEKEFSAFACVYFKLVKCVYFLFDTTSYGHVDFPLLCHDCCMIFENGCTTVQLVLSHWWLLPAFHDCRWSLRMSLIYAQVFPPGLWQKEELRDIKVTYI